MQFKVIEFYPDKHTLVVRFWDDNNPKRTEIALAADSNRNADGTPVRCTSDRAITIWQVPMPTGDALAQIISAHAPTRQWELEDAIADENVDTSMTPLLEMVGVPFDVMPSEEISGGVTVKVITQL